jgi:nitric oxide reductase subunit C
MSHRTAKLIFWVGTLTSLVLFLALTADASHQFAALTHADKLDNHVVAGKHAFTSTNWYSDPYAPAGRACSHPDLFTWT